ncbi:hypothetical protein Ciccas_004893 [Cichlidogyrus casuarinus]|uniref:Uncharacterized protein n=1 Tax=Cichlidogyrus casuarinus TaxID=1844966 RepID=A0ABD2QA98_9PLAT
MPITIQKSKYDRAVQVTAERGSESQIQDKSIQLNPNSESFKSSGRPAKWITRDFFGEKEKIDPRVGQRVTREMDTDKKPDTDEVKKGLDMLKAALDNAARRKSMDTPRFSSFETCVCQNE